MQEYVKEHHEEGLEWNDSYGEGTAEQKLEKLLGVSQRQHERGQPSLHFDEEATQTQDQNAVPIPASGSALLPPPPPPPPPMSFAPAPGADAGANASKMFDEINKLGEDGVRSKCVNDTLRTAEKGS